jgi:Flp pilus assembly protein TadG
MIAKMRRFRRQRRGAVIVEFALVVPFLFLIVFGIIDFSRAYAQLNNINSSLREGARFGAAQKNPTVASIQDEVIRFSTTWGNPLIRAEIDVAIGDDITVSVTDYPITLPTLGGFLNLAGRQITVSRAVTYRWERSCPISSPTC